MRCRQAERQRRKKRRHEGMDLTDQAVGWQDFRKVKPAVAPEGGNHSIKPQVSIEIKASVTNMPNPAAVAPHTVVRLANHRESKEKTRHKRVADAIGEIVGRSDAKDRAARSPNVEAAE